VSFFPKYSVVNKQEKHNMKGTKLKEKMVEEEGSGRKSRMADGPAVAAVNPSYRSGGGTARSTTSSFFYQVCNL
jgi:hypothetical protein